MIPDRIILQGVSSGSGGVRSTMTTPNRDRRSKLLHLL
jgi:hypothetical protein